MLTYAPFSANPQRIRLMPDALCLIFLFSGEIHSEYGKAFMRWYADELLGML